MALHCLQVEHFRCITQAELQFSPTRNLISGSNASGKTTLLEAIFVLGSGRSFRSTRLEALTQFSYSDFQIVGDIQDRQRGSTRIGIRCGPTSKQLRIDGRAAETLGELVTRFPVQVIDPEVHKLIEEGPKRRRQFIDWGVFHVEQLFHGVWRNYSRALKQRNAALALGSKANADIWDLELATHGEVIDQYRRHYLDALYPFIAQAGKSLLESDIVVEYVPGWKRQVTLHQALRESAHNDLKRGTTTVGPHRADLLLKVGGHIVKERISRGQQKLLACALILAQQMHRASLGSPPASLLLDDPSAELDVDNLRRLLNVIADLPVQLFITMLSKVGLEQFADAKMFHIESGRVSTMA